MTDWTGIFNMVFRHLIRVGIYCTPVERIKVETNGRTGMFTIAIVIGRIVLDALYFASVIIDSAAALRKRREATADLLHLRRVNLTVSLTK